MPSTVVSTGETNLNTASLNLLSGILRSRWRNRSVNTQWQHQVQWRWGLGAVVIQGDLQGGVVEKLDQAEAEFCEKHEMKWQSRFRAGKSVSMWSVCDIFWGMRKKLQWVRAQTLTDVKISSKFWSRLMIKAGNLGVIPGARRKWTTKREVSRRKTR